MQVLVIEPNSTRQAALVSLLAGDATVPAWETKPVAGLSAAIAAIQAQTPDVVLTAIDLPDAPGLQALSALRIAGLAMPIVIVVETPGHELAMLAIQAGAQDVLVRGELDTRRLAAALRMAVERKRVELKTAALKEEYLSTITHELRAPLLVIQESAALVLDGSLGTINDDQHGFLRTITTHVDRMRELVNNLLDLSKVDARRLVLARRAMDLGALVTTACETLQLVAKGRTVRAVCAPAPPVFGDANRLTQVLTNLLTNAIKFTPQGGSITAKVQADGEWVRCSVTDTGTGIPEEYHQELFQRFRQLQSSTGSRPQGTGLGLAICKELVELHGGTIGIESGNGNGPGATFTFTVPAYEESRAFAVLFDETIADSRHKDGQFGLLVLDCQAACEAVAKAAARPYPEAVRDFEETIRRALRGDRVIMLDERLLVVLAVTHPDGMGAIQRRLQAQSMQWLEERLGASSGARIHSACAMYPQDAQSLQRLLHCAQSRLTPS